MKEPKWTFKASALESKSKHNFYNMNFRSAKLVSSILILSFLIINQVSSGSLVQLGNTSLQHLQNQKRLQLTSNASLYSINHKNNNNQQAQQSASSNSQQNEKICIGTSNRLSAQSNKTDHLHNLAERYKNCTYVMGNLEITWLDRDVDLSFLESIREITGYLLIAYVEAKTIRMPNLQIIRGRELFRLTKSEHEFALFAMENQLQNLELPNFREILAGSVGFYYNKNLCHNRISWDEIINWPTYQSHFQHDGEAMPQCKDCDPSCNGFCWGEGPEMCQKFSKNNCAIQCNGGRCFGVNPRECCHLFCAGGCTGPKQTDCLACKLFNNDGECIQECPPIQRYNPQKLLWEHNPLGRYAFGGKCVTECPAHLLRDNGACVRTCPPNKKPNTNGECVPCTEPCQKECQGVDVIHSGNIDQLVNCTVIEGSLTILESSFSGYADVYPNGTIKEHLQAMHPDRLEVLKNIREITGYLNIQANHIDFKNLSYFRNLQTIGGRQTTDMFYSLSIIKTSLNSLNLRSLKKVRSGRIIIEDNKELCFADTIDWYKLNVTKLEDITIRSNGDSNKCRQNNLVCHKQCSQDGCWGPGADECLTCRNYKLEQECVENCRPIYHLPASGGSLSSNNQNPSDNKHNNYPILSYDAGKRHCKRCHQECRDGCNGTEAIHCWRCRNVKDASSCVPECPANKFNRMGLCEECDKSCAGGCSGPSNRLGEGGCNACARTVYTSVNEGSPSFPAASQQQQAYCIRAEDSCPAGYYQEYQFGKPVCRRCHQRCKSCSGLGTHVSVCECAKYQAGEQCEDACPRDYFPNEPSGQCVKCSSECNGCFGPTEADCISCRVYRIYHETPTSGSLARMAAQKPIQHAPEAMTVDSSPLATSMHDSLLRQQSKFNCTAQCPGDKPFRISDSNMLDPYCSEYGELDGNPKIVSLMGNWSFFFIILTITLVLMASFYIYRFQIERDKTVKLTMHLSGIDDVEPLTPSNLKPNLAPLISIKETELRKGNVLGSGFGGTVYQGAWYPDGNEDKKRIVAIKVLRDNGQSNMFKEFLDEAYIMASVNHPNLVRLLAVCMTPNNLMLVTQLMPLGCLLDYVRNHKNEIGSKSLLEWCKQIARGMAYLEEHRMVHRDLALRNVLLQTCGRALISDFGLAKFLDIDQSEYSHTGGGRLPIKWLAPECISKRKFTHKSDVWAFGVTIWELLTFGQVPFEDIDTKQVPMEIEKGFRLKQPPHVSVEVYKVMYSCWVYQPDERPHFSSLANDFTKFARDPERFLTGRSSLRGIEYKQHRHGTGRCSSQESCDGVGADFNHHHDEFTNCTDEEVMSPAVTESHTPSTGQHLPTSENKFNFENTSNHLFSASDFRMSNNLGNSNSVMGRPLAHHSSNSLGQRSSTTTQIVEQPTDQEDYLMPSPCNSNTQNEFEFKEFRPRHSELPKGLPLGPGFPRDPPHSAGLIGICNEEYFQANYVTSKSTAISNSHIPHSLV